MGLMGQPGVRLKGRRGQPVRDLECLGNLAEDKQLGHSSWSRIYISLGHCQEHTSLPREVAQGT